MFVDPTIFRLRRWWIRWFDRLLLHTISCWIWSWKRARVAATIFKDFFDFFLLSILLLQNSVSDCHVTVSRKSDILSEYRFEKLQKGFERWVYLAHSRVLWSPILLYLESSKHPPTNPAHLSDLHWFQELTEKVKKSVFFHKLKRSLPSQMLKMILTFSFFWKK